MANQNKAISSFDIIRKLVRNLYLEGFNNYLDTDSVGKSSRAFTNNLNSIRNFLDERFISSKTSTKKKTNPVISFNTRDETENPLFALWKTENSIATNLSFDFAIMDILEENPDGISWFSLTSDSNSTKHDNHLENYVNKGIDKKSVKPKLEKLANTGIIEFFENGKKIRKVNTRQIKQLLSSTEVKQAIQFASETSPLGVIGSYILDNLKTVDSESLNTPIHYKHHFIFNSIDYEIMYILMDAISNKNTVEIETERYGIKTVIPLKLYISTQTGRTYIIFWDLHESILFSENLEKILAAKQLEICSEYESYISKLSEIESNIWGVAFKKENSFNLEHVRFVLEYSPEEESYIPSRIRKEAVTGTVSDIDESHIEFTADLIDSKEMIPWIRSFFCRITDIDFPYADRIKEDVSLLSHNKYLEDVVSSFLNLSNYESQIESEITPLFNPIYSTYYLISRKLIEKYVKSQRTPIRKEEIEQIIKETAYIEAPGELYDIIYNSNEDLTTIFSYSTKTKELSSSIKNVPEFPLSTIELRFLAAILQDKRIRMFMNDKTVQAIETELENVLPLWKPENVKYFDQNKDSDPFENPDYRILFKTILKAINTKQNLHLVYGRKNFSNIYTPTHLDYSQKDDTFRLYVKEIKYPINLRNIKECSITTESPTFEEESTEYETLKVEIFDNTKAHYHFNRAIRQFSYFKKSCKKTEKNNTYEMSVDYDKSDESEIVIKVLMFGPNMKVLEPQSVIDEIKKRVTRQNQLFELEF